MANYEHLPVYKNALDLLVQIEQAVCGFPLRLLKHYKERARQQRLAYVVIAQTGQVLKTGIQHRELTEVLTFDLQESTLLP